MGQILSPFIVGFKVVLDLAKVTYYSKRIFRKRTVGKLRFQSKRALGGHLISVAWGMVGVSPGPCRLVFEVIIMLGRFP